MVAPKPFHIYPGAVIPVDEQEALDLLEYMKTFGEPKPLPPGVPLDEDIFEGILWHLHAVHSHYDNELILTMTQNAFDRSYMEVLWRQIKRKKE